MNTSQLQFLQANLKTVLKDIQEDIITYKALKRHFDETGVLNKEYVYHDLIKSAKVSLKKFVSLQKAVKAALK